MKYKALTNIHHNGDRVLFGNEIELSDAEAAPLLKSGAIEQVIKPFSKGFKKTEPHPNNQEQ